MKNSPKLSPSLRFRDSTENEFPEWDKSLLGDVVEFSKGKGISKSDIVSEGLHKCIRYGELYTHYNETISAVVSSTDMPESQLVLSQRDDVIIPTSGETALDIASASCVLIDGVAIGGDLTILRSQQNGVFLAYYLNHKKREISRFAQGVSVIHLYASSLKQIQVSLPCPEEQKKIASFLSAVDRKIEQLNHKKALYGQFKEGMLQKLFSQEFRFKDDSGRSFPDWKNVHLREILSYEQPNAYTVGSTDYDGKFQTPVLTAGKTFILGYTDEESGIFRKRLPVIIFDDFTTAFKFVDFPFKVKSGALKILLPKHQGVNLKYVFEAMKIIKFPVGEHKRYWISEFQDEEILYPSLAEQQKIADFLLSIDKKIEIVEKQIELTQNFKKGLLQQMFV